MNKKQELLEKYSAIKETLAKEFPLAEVTVGFEDFDTRIWFVVYDPDTKTSGVFRPIVTNWFSRITHFTTEAQTHMEVSSQTAVHTASQEHLEQFILDYQREVETNYG